MSSALYREIPSQYIFILLVNGLIILYLTPLQFVLPISINPLAQKNPTDALASVAFASLSSVIIGSFGLFVRNKIIGNGGLNTYLRQLLKLKLKRIKQPNKLSQKESINFYLWTKSEGVNDIISFLQTQYAILSGLIIGSEIAAISNLILILLLVFSKGIFTKGLFLLIILLVISIVVLTTSIVYDKKFFKNTYIDQYEVIRERYKKESAGIYL